MFPSFVIPFPTRIQIRSRPPRRNTTPVAATSENLYSTLGIPQLPDPKTLSQSQIRHFYLTLAKTTHPDTSPSDQTPPNTFDKISHAWSILSDPHLRKVYDTSGHEGLQALHSISERAADIRQRFSDLPGEQLDYLSDTGQLVPSLLSPAPQPTPTPDDLFDPTLLDRQDACPRSVEEAIWNITSHPDRTVRYYGLWWIYRFKVSDAEHALVNVLKTSSETTALGGFGLRRRAALALGAVASPPTRENNHAALALLDALRSSDYFLRYRAAEALANIAHRYAAQPDICLEFPEQIVDQLKAILTRAAERIASKEAARSGYVNQEGLFDLERYTPEVRARLEKIFQERRRNEEMSRRTTMTPQLGVDEVGAQADEPLEWVMKAASAICAADGREDLQLLRALEKFTANDVPLVRYAAHKALYALTGLEEYAQVIVGALGYGIEHHYSQRVLIRDLGDLGYCQGAAAVAACPMVENSFKILALKNMLAKHEHDPKVPDVRNVLSHMDSLL